MKLKEIVLGTDEESKKRAVQENLGQHVILNDVELDAWRHGILIRNEPRDRYMVQFDGGGIAVLAYASLKHLLVIENDPNYPRPIIKTIQ